MNEEASRARNEETSVRTLDGVHIVTGTVVPGDQRGRLLGFPTANIVLPHALEVPDGIWAGLVRLDGRGLPAAVSLGVRPTYYQAGDHLLEAHILSFAADIYGQEVSVALLRFLRHEQRFETSDHLVRQMRRDVQRTRTWASGPEYSAAARAIGISPIWSPTPASPEERIGRRRWRYEHVVASAVREARKAGALSHETVAAIASVPLEQLRWSHPTVEDLQDLGDRVRG